MSQIYDISIASPQNQAFCRALNGCTTDRVTYVTFYMVFMVYMPT